MYGWERRCLVEEYIIGLFCLDLSTLVGEVRCPPTLNTRGAMIVTYDFTSNALFGTDGRFSNARFPRNV